MNWKAGDRAIVNFPESPNGHHGKETTILRVGVSVRGEYVGYEVDLPAHLSQDFFFCVYEYHELKPIYDGNEKVSWESMKDIYQPSPVVTI